MRYGVLIDSGVTDWQIVQQDETGKAEIRLRGHYTTTRLAPPVPFQFEAVDGRAVEIYARVVQEETGGQVLPWQACTLEADDRWHTALAGVPAGGLYRVETRMEYEGWDGYSVTRGDMVHHVGVGDVFVVAGQSNACGRAKTPLYDPPEIGVHVLRGSGCWDLASHPLNETTRADRAGHFENHNPGHSPFLHFAKCLRRALGYPIGLVITAHGGTPLSWWNPAENGALMDNMVEILKRNKIRPRAMLWYQGEAEGYEDGSSDYLNRFAQFVQGSREALTMPRLPVLTVQLGRYLIEADESLDRHWGRVRQAQRDAMYTIDEVYTVPANDLSLYDTVHLSPEGNMALAERLANAALAVLYGKPIRWRAPELASARKTAPGAVRIVFSHIDNKLDAYSQPACWLPIEAEDEGGLVAVERYTLERDGLELVFARALGAQPRLHGMWRMNPGVAVLQDLGRLPALSFYGFPIEEE